ncbi:hypothetical protein KUH32_04165 [Thalassococcus sp. CAU 1522]|uniref:Uncharacterized protein n=1 Tax=Thalassococcus arenae TaxID=2851652 RepID=A0ABS6N4L5_9RHOB|nr:hypothetical protein [Thalassococcus arenae]MBV2358960.1 hypothetical protein [Thalassococcus arenae]
MTTLTSPFAPATDTRDKPKPAPPRSGPVLIGDCITPWGGETMLLALMRRWQNAPEDRDV